MKHADKKKSDEMKSVCEKSMELVVNIIKISSFSMAAMNLGKGERKSPLKNCENMSRSKTKTSVHDDENFSDYIKRFHKRNKNDHAYGITDGKAAAFIRRFHEKNSRELTLPAPPLLPLPPPPPPPPHRQFLKNF